jgi:WD40 repeat protein
MNRPTEEFVKKLCDEFRFEWPASKTRLLILDYLSENPELDPIALIKALVPLEIQLRQTAGETLRASEYKDLGEVAFSVAQRSLGEVDEDSEAPSSLSATEQSTLASSITTNLLLGSTKPDESFHKSQPLSSSTEQPKQENDFTQGQPNDLALQHSAPYVATEHGAHPKMIGRYRLLEEIGNGGMGSVFRAEQRTPVQRMVALKLIRADINSKDAIVRFEAEQQAIALMDHPNIAKILDAGQTESGSPFFVMELVGGIPLNKYCDQNKLGIRERLELMLPVCRAVQHAHQKGIIHRDLKHSNVLVTQSDGAPTPKVIDFGMAKALGHKRVLTKSTLYTEVGKIVGTIQYMSPEQAASSDTDVDTRSDVYSLGVMVYKLLTGSTPLEKATVANLSLLEALQLIGEKNPIRPSTQLSREPEQLAKIARKRQTPPEKLRLQLSGDLDWIVMKALENDRADRYQTVNDLALDIERYLNDETVSARPPSTVYMLKKFVKRNRRLVASLAAISFLLIAGIIGTTAMSLWALSERKIANEASELSRTETRKAQRAEQQQIELQDKAEINLQALKMKSAWSNWNSGDIEDAMRMLNEVDDSKSGWEHDFLRAEFHPAERVLYGHSTEVMSIDVSADGKYFASTGLDHAVKIWNTKDKSLVRTLLLDDITTCVRFSPDSKQIAVCSFSNQVTIWDTESGEEQFKTDGLQSDILCLAFVPESDLIAVGLSNMDTLNEGELIRAVGETDLPPSVHLISRESGKTVQVLEGHTGDVLALQASADGQLLISGSEDSSIGMWRKNEAGQFSLERLLKNHFGEVTGISISHSVDEFFSSSEDQTIRVWRLTDGELIRTVPGGRKLNSVDSSEDGERIVASSDDRTAIVWKKTGEQLIVCKGHFLSVNDARFINKDSQLVTASSDETLRTWNSSKNPNTIKLKAHDLTVWDDAMSRDGKLLACASEDKTVSFVNFETGELLPQKLRLEYPVLSLDFSPNSETLVTAGSGPEISDSETDEPWVRFHVWNSNSKKLTRTIDAHRGSIWDINYSPDGKLVATASQDNTVCIWNTEDWSLLTKLTDHTNVVASARFSPDGCYLVTASDDETVKLWDTTSWELLHTFVGHEHIVWRAVISPDGDTLASSGYEGSLILWSISKRKMIMPPIRAHEDQIAGLAFSPDGKRIVTASDDRRIKVWDVASGVEFLVLRDRVGSNMVSASFSDDGTKLISGDSDGWVTIRSSKKHVKDEVRFLPTDGIRIIVDGHKQVIDPNVSEETLHEVVKKTEKCCKYYPTFQSFTVLGIAQYKLGEFEEAIASMRESIRLEPIEYGESDVRPDSEGYLTMALLKVGDVDGANAIRKVFDEKRLYWSEDERVIRLGNEIDELFEDQ